MKAKLFNSVKAYGYFLVRKSDGLKYVGIRYANVKLNLTPSEDFGKVYFTSGKLKREFKSNPDSFEFRLCYTFDTLEEMWEWERRVTMRVYKKPDWANQGWASNYGDNPGIGRLISEGKNKVKRSGKTSIEEGADSLKEWIYNTPQGEAYRQDLSDRMTYLWKTKPTEEIEAWKQKRKDNMDFKAAAAKASIALSKVGEDGLTGRQRNSRAAVETMRTSGQLSKQGKDRNIALNRKVGEMTDEEFDKFCEGKALCFQKGMLTRRLTYIKNRESNNELSQT